MEYRFSGYDFVPQLADIDGDGDVDLLMRYYSELTEENEFVFVENIGTSTAPVFVLRTGSANPFDGFDPFGGFALVDLEGDGALGLVVADHDDDGTLKYFSSPGPSTEPELVLRAGDANPFNGMLDVGDVTALALDGDGGLAFALTSKHGGSYYKNKGTSTAPELEVQTGNANPIDGIDGSSALGDLDGDGDVDLVTCTSDGSLIYSENTGTTTEPVFVQKTGTANPFDGINVGSDSVPALGDLDGDGTLRPCPSIDKRRPHVFLSLAGDLDLVVGVEDGELNYIENTGTSTAPAFVLREGDDNPFEGIGVGSEPPQLVDIDGDGDLDLVRERDIYLENTGTSTAPAFVPRDKSANPFISPLDSFDSMMQLDLDDYVFYADIDGDGTLRQCPSIDKLRPHVLCLSQATWTSLCKMGGTSSTISPTVTAPRCAAVEACATAKPTYYRRATVSRALRATSATTARRGISGPNANSVPRSLRPNQRVKAR